MSLSLPHAWCQLFELKTVGPKPIGILFSSADGGYSRDRFRAWNRIARHSRAPEQLDDLLLSLADDETKKLRYIQARNDCDFAAEHPEFFNDPPTAPVLRAVSSTYTQLFNAVMAHAIALSKGEIPPSLFDPSTLKPPIVEPSLVLRKRDLLLEGSFVDFWVNKDLPGITKNDHDLVLDIGLLAASAIKSFESIQDPLR